MQYWLISANALAFLYGGFYWMKNKCLLLSTFCNFQTPLTLLTYSAMIQGSQNPWSHTPRWLHDNNDDNNHFHDFDDRHHDCQHDYDDHQHDDDNQSIIPGGTNPWSNTAGRLPHWPPSCWDAENHGLDDDGYYYFIISFCSYWVVGWRVKYF